VLRQLDRYFDGKARGLNTVENVHVMLGYSRRFLSIRNVFTRFSPGRNRLTERRRKPELVACFRSQRFSDIPKRVRLIIVV
jgi:hypothetical protein